jgi:4-hydroxyphenylacetate 3-monooxygenase
MGEVGTEALRVKTGGEHIRSLKDGRSVYVDGKLVQDVATHPAYRNAVASAAGLYDHQARPANVERMTFDIGGGHRVNRCWQLPRSLDDLVERRRALTEWAELTCGFMGRSPDHVASSLSGQLMGIEVFRAYDARRAAAFEAYMDYARRNDLYLTYVINNVQGDRSKSFGDQGQGAEDLVARIVDEDAEGITIRGAKLFATGAIMANEIFVGSGQPLKPGEEHLAFACALPMGAKGLRMLSRKSFEAHAVSEFDNPLSSRFDENDALIFFDDVKVPWDRVFVHRNVDMCRAQFHDTPGHIYQNYQAQIRLAVKLKFLLGLARKVAETIGTLSFPNVRDTLGKLASQVALIDGMVRGMEAGGGLRNGYYLPDRHLLYAAQVYSQELYPEVVKTIRELAGGALLMLPSSVDDFANPELARIITATQVSPSMSGMERIKVLKLAWDAVGSEFASRHLQYEMFYAGAQYVTRGHSFRTYDWDEPARLVADVLDRYDSPLEATVAKRTAA